MRSYARSSGSGSRSEHVRPPPSPAGTPAILALQRTAGNRAVASLMRFKRDGEEQEPPEWDQLEWPEARQLQKDIERRIVELTDSEQAEFDQRLNELRASWRPKGGKPLEEPSPSSTQPAAGPVESTAGAREHERAKRLHIRDRYALKQAVVDAASAPDERLRNSAEWISTGKSALYALTPTGDSADRAKTAGRSGERAYFGYPDNDPDSDRPVGGHVLDAETASYDTEDMARNHGVIFDSPDSAGFRTAEGRKIFVVQPSRIDAINALRKEMGQKGRFPPVSETLKHETQHEADRLFEPASTVADSALAEYQTEFRAYSAQGAAWLSDRPDPRDQEKLGLLFPDPVQFQIFHQIYTRYERVKAAWDHDAVLKDGTPFRTAVLRTRGQIQDVSMNPHNSPRVDGFWEALGPATAKDDPRGRATTELVSVLRSFTGSDAGVISKSRYYKAQKLPAWLRALVDLLLKTPDADPSPVLGKEAGVRKERERAARGGRNPSANEMAAAFTSWEALEEAIKPQLGDEEVADALDPYRGSSGSQFAIALAMFVNDVAGKIDWWPLIDARTRD